ncbi:hypothetical protein GCM10010517_20480 [Streptosporangium fragile]|uniref:Uncharacterized protein n=1 Tax=Streptosporangium fragile TaxID=46186 RepID=A0ABN3VTV1_9ACTN
MPRWCPTWRTAQPHGRTHSPTIAHPTVTQPCGRAAPRSYRSRFARLEAGRGKQEVEAGSGGREARGGARERDRENKRRRPQDAGAACFTSDATRRRAPGA